MNNQIKTFMLAAAVLITVNACKKDDALPADTRPILDSVIQGGGARYPNKVFIDLSESRQTTVLRTSWDLGFYTGAEFRVTLNSSTNMMAKALTKNDLLQVSEADTVGFAAQMSFSNFDPAALPYIDYPDGDLLRTAVAEVSAMAADNKVYIISRGTDTLGKERGWKKIRILRNGSNGYLLQYADIAATTFKEVAVKKDVAYHFNYLQFEAGLVNAEPVKAKWDIAWTYFANTTALSPTQEIPYLFQDFIIQNRNVQTAKVLTSNVRYDNFTETNLAGLTFVTAQNGIGADWRSGGGPSSGPSIRADRFYVIKDGAGNYYKLQFISLTKNGERGWPMVKYALVKKGG
jgi:hypothetical protein